MEAAAATAESSSTMGRSSGGGATADSYIGSLISLTSKSEIRYEGILYNINTEESSIGLRNVRSFGTEGRKKDGPQVPPSDKIYEYILFRGSDIKDLQVKSSPPVQTAPPINSDPAIIQSHYSRPATSATSLPTNVSGSLTDLGSQSAQLGHPGSNFQSGLPLYQPGGNVGSWGPSPPPQNANGGGLAMPMYWQGFYGAPNGLPQMHQQSLLRPPPGLLMPPSMQQMQFSGFNPSLASGPSNLPEYPTPLASSTTNSLHLAPSSLPASSLPSTVPPMQPMTLASETLPATVSNKGPVSGIPSSTLGASLPSVSSLTSSGPDVNAVIPPISGMPNVISVTPLSHQRKPLPITTVDGTFNPVVAEAPSLSLITPGQLLQSGATAGLAAVPSIQSSQTAQRDVEVVQVSPKPSPEPLATVHAEAQPPILPLPQSARSQKPNGANFHTRQNYRGRGGREAVMSRPVTSFAEEFDFTAMNEKFKKEEVWGSLGKSSKIKDETNANDEDDADEEDDRELPKVEMKPVYNKDDFFDNLSSNALDNNSNHGRMRFSEQLKLDTETTKRKGWINHGIKGPESIADHMYRMALMALIAGDIPGVNRERCIKIAIVHDIAEAIVGDITPSDNVPKEEKSRMEQAALIEMCKVLGGGMRAEEIKELWEEYENKSSLEANLVKDFDKVEMILQALEYETEHGKVLDEFFLSTAGKIETEIGKSWAAEIISRRNSRLKNRGG